VPNPERLYTDSAAVCNFALDAQMALKHRMVNHSKEWVVPNTRIHTNTVESSFSPFEARTDRQLSPRLNKAPTPLPERVRI
jgi:hypothetical protein